jgi:single-stranded-DNA-specific exonuclease
MPTYTIRATPSVPDTTLTTYSSLVRTLLLGRGIVTDEAAAEFLTPLWERDIHDPFLLKDMMRVCERILAAMRAGETIVIWSDYDMDGIPGAVVLWDFFRTIGYGNVVHHTPHRNIDGFGLNRSGLDALKAAGAHLVITVDCGIGDVEMVTYANEIGLEVIVTDHHIPGEVLPPAYAIINPKQKDCAYPEPMLCGAGVAFKVVQGLLAHIGVHAANEYILPAPGWEKWLLDMAGMSTIADMVPLKGENRALAHFGLVVLRKSRRPGLHALLKKAKADQRYLTEDDIGFTIAPRINAASRMGHARDAFQLLATNDLPEAGTLAVELDRINTERKTVVAVMKREIKHRLDHVGALKEVLVMGNPEWKPSLLGLVAGGLAEEFNRPVFLWGREEGVTIKGSCRSGGGVSVYEIMKSAEVAFIECGGHAQAGGFSLAQEEVHTLEAGLIASHKKIAQAEVSVVQEVDAVLSVEDITWDTYRSIAQLAPFGEGNPKPRFVLRNVTLAGVRTFGKGNEHLELSIATTRTRPLKAIAFFSGVESFGVPLVEGMVISLIVYFEASYFRGIPELRLRLIAVDK